MTIIGAVLAIIYYVLGLLGALAWAGSLGWTTTLGLVLWNSFFGFSMLVTCMLVWSREHWLG
jgi:uncharacterized membrane-anchored protein